MAVDPQMMQQMMAQLGGGQPPAPPMEEPQQQGGPQDDPEMMQQMMAQLGGGQAQDVPNGDWLTEAINSVHEGMVQEQDPQVVSMIGAILNNLTTVQAKLMSKGGNAQGG